MKRMRSMLLVALFALCVPLGCGDDEELDLTGDGGSLNGGGGTTGGGSGGTGGTSGDSATTGGGTAGTAGSAGNTGGAAGSAGADAGECAVQGTTYQFNWCPVLVSPEDAPSLTVSIVPGYFGTIHADCRISKLVDEHPEIAIFANDLTTFTLELWGCVGDGVQDFGLVNSGVVEASLPALSAADANLLIQIYVARTKTALGLPPGLEKLLTDTLTCLSKGAITDPSTTEFALSTCPPDAGVDGSDADLDGGTD